MVGGAREGRGEEEEDGITIFEKAAHMQQHRLEGSNSDTALLQPMQGTQHGLKMLGMQLGQKR